MTLTTQPALTDRVTVQQPPHRFERLREWMEAEDLDACLTFGPRHAAHLAGYSRYWAGPSAVVVARDGTRTLVVMYDEAPVARDLGDADVVVSYGERGFGINLEPLPLLAAVVAELPEVRAARRVGVADELGGMAALLRSASGARQVDATEPIWRMRLVKDEDELVKVLHSYELCWIGHAALAELAQQPGVTEIELFSAGQSAAQNAYGSPIEFMTDLLSGPKTADVCCPIHVASPRVVQPGEPIVADIALGAGGYWGDSAETHIAGQNDEVSELRSKLLEILADSTALLRPGNTGAEIYQSVSTQILDTFPGGEFPHHVGHALGLSGFEDPHLIPSDETPLENWMVLAVEPGIYFPGGVGARVENLFIVTPDGGVELRDAFGAR
jgi:Xaa-Pro aminopeptidase